MHWHNIIVVGAFLGSSSIDALLVPRQGDLDNVAGNPEITWVMDQLNPKDVILYNGGLPHYQDIGQRELGDCWLAAAAAAMALRNPSHLKASLFDLGNGKAEVKLWDWTTMTPHVYQFEKPIPNQRSGGSQMTTPVSAGGGGAWPYILQKGFYSLAKDAPALAIATDLNGGTAFQAFMAISGTGPPWQTLNPGSESVDTLWKLLVNAAHAPSTASTPDCSGGKSDICASKDKLTNNLIPDHVYTVMSADRDMGMVQLRNPWAMVSENNVWGTPEDGGAGIISGTDGCFNISFADFQKFYTEVDQIGTC